MELDPLLLPLLACPRCRSPLAADDAREQLVCTDTAEPGGCGLRFPVTDNTPVLLLDEALPRDA